MTIAYGEELSDGQQVRVLVFEHVEQNVLDIFALVLVPRAEIVIPKYYKQPLTTLMVVKTTFIKYQPAIINVNNYNIFRKYKICISSISTSTQN